MKILLLMVKQLAFFYLLAISILLLPPVIFLVQQLAFHFDPPTQSIAEITAATASSWRIVVWGSDVHTILTSAEASHLQDVHKVLIGFYALMIFVLILTRKVSFRLSQLWYWHAIWIIFFTTIGFAFFFPIAFDTFHQLFFPQGNYIFPENSLLIQSFPYSFWFIEFCLLQFMVLLGLCIRAIQARHADPEIF